MAKRGSCHPTPLELEILKVLWRQGPSTVRQVRERLGGRRKLAHTTVMTMMGIMTEKGYLDRCKKGRSYLYTAVAAENQTLSTMLGDVVQRAFDGSTMAAMVHLLQMEQVDEAELAELRKLIRQKEKGA